MQSRIVPAEHDILISLQNVWNFGGFEKTGTSAKWESHHNDTFVILCRNNNWFLSEDLSEISEYRHTGIKIINIRAIILLVFGMACLYDSP